RMLADSLRWKLAAAGRPESETLAELTELILDAQNGARRLAKGLFPVEVDAAGLMAALRELADSVGQNGVECIFECDSVVAVSRNDVATHLFRIAQEAVNNSVRHGQAQHVTIRLSGEGETLSLEIIDDGCGLPDDFAERSGGMGLRIMRYRAGAIGAAFDVRPADGCGTHVTCTLRRAAPPRSRSRNSKDSDAMEPVEKPS
ncbi:MAG: histidine kinase, partial [Planctomycetes bacterium]|nr:histidine kinase [Planctomycetota bacterium]